MFNQQPSEITVQPQTNQWLPAMSISDVIARRNTMVDFVKAALKDKTDFGVIPGTDKPTLLKPGAEKLCTLFGFSPRFAIVESEKDWTGANHNGESFFYFCYRAQLYRGDTLIAESDGSCSSMEKKYRWRNAERRCPSCGKSTIIKGRQEYGGGYICFTKKGGCGAKFGDNEPSIIEQQVGQVANPDIADQVNTIQKMAQKRALIAATLLAVNASEFFTQDIEDLSIDGTFSVVEPERKPVAPTKPAAPKPAPLNPDTLGNLFSDEPCDHSHEFTADDDASEIARQLWKLSAKTANSNGAPDKTELGRIGSVINTCFETKPDPERDAIRHAIYSYIIRREIKTGKDLCNGIIKAMLSRWEKPNDQYKPNEIATHETWVLAKQYQIEHGQTEMAL